VLQRRRVKSTAAGSKSLLLKPSGRMFKVHASFSPSRASREREPGFTHLFRMLSRAEFSAVSRREASPEYAVDGLESANWSMAALDPLQGLR
jgi:hypothetical protein